VSAAAVELGFVVLRPLCEGRRYDLVLDLDPTLIRVQCKLATYRNGAVVVGLQTNRLTPAGYVQATYSTHEVDAVGAYWPRLHRCFLIPIAHAAGRRSLHLRVDPARNRQCHGIRWASSYAFDAVAHLLRACEYDIPSAPAS
jgi:hypothetical protein